MWVCLRVHTLVILGLKGRMASHLGLNIAKAKLSNVNYFFLSLKHASISTAGGGVDIFTYIMHAPSKINRRKEGKREGERAY